MTATRNFHLEISNGPIAAVDVTSITWSRTNFGSGIVPNINSPEAIILVQVCCSNTADASAATITITDPMNLTWTSAGSVVYDGTNATRHEVFWARAPNRGPLYSITATFSKSVSMAKIGYHIITGADNVEPIDPNANGIKTESHTAAAASAITGLTTTYANAFVFSFYASRTVATDPGLPTSGLGTFVNQYGSSPTLMMHSDALEISSAASSASITYPNSSATGSMIALAVTITRTDYQGIRLVQGFEGYDHFGSGGDLTGGLGGSSLNGIVTGTISILGAATFETGRDGVGKAFGCNGHSLSSKTLYFSALGGAWMLNGNYNGTGGDNWLDGQHYYVGFNVKVGAGDSVTPTGPQAVFFWGSSSTVRLMVAWDITTRTWKFYLGDIGGTLLAESSSGSDPFTTWTWVEMHLYIGASGRFEMWTEDGGASRDHSASPGQTTPMTQIINYSGDLSIATVGVMNAFSFSSGWTSGSNYMGHHFDDLVFSTGDRMHGPCTILTQFPTQDVSVSGWVASDGGGTNYNVVDEDVVDRNDYIEASSGNPKTIFTEFTPHLGYVPKAVAAVVMGLQMRCVSPTAKDVTALCISNGVENWGWTMSIGNQDGYVFNVMSGDPATRQPWTIAAAQQTTGGPWVNTIDPAGSAQSLVASAQMFQFWRQLVLSERNDPNFTDPINHMIGMSPLIHGQVNAAADLHPIETGIKT